MAIHQEAGKRQNRIRLCCSQRWGGAVGVLTFSRGDGDGFCCAFSQCACVLLCGCSCALHPLLPCCLVDVWLLRCVAAPSVWWCLVDVWLLLMLPLCGGVRWMCGCSCSPWLSARGVFRTAIVIAYGMQVGQGRLLHEYCAYVLNTKYKVLSLYENQGWSGPVVRCDCVVLLCKRVVALHTVQCKEGSHMCCPAPAVLCIEVSCMRCATPLVCCALRCSVCPGGVVVEHLVTPAAPGVLTLQQQPGHTAGREVHALGCTAGVG
jgi:hypothetical protein